MLTDTTHTLFTGTPMIQKVMTVMIRHHELLFPAVKDAAPSPAPAKKLKSKKAANPRSFVGWESAEVVHSIYWKQTNHSSTLVYSLHDRFIYNQCTHQTSKPEKWCLQKRKTSNPRLRHFLLVTQIIYTSMNNTLFMYHIKIITVHLYYSQVLLLTIKKNIPCL